MDIGVIVSKQAGKSVFTGVMTASLAVSELRKGTLSVNSEAQRSLAKGANKESSMELLDSDKVHNTPRMKSFVAFIDRVMKQAEREDNSEGFLGAVQLVIPEGETGATFEALDVDADERKRNSTLAQYIKSLGNVQAGTLTVNPIHGQSAMHIVDGQGRIFGLHSFERAVQVQLEKVRREIRKLEKAALTSKEPKKAQEELKVQQANEEALMRHHQRIAAFLSETHLAFVCYVDHIDKEGRVVGLPLKAEKRLYIEGNALNAQASKEEVLRYESFSPVIVDLEQYRTTQEWLDDDYIEDDSKSIGSNSTRLFTLSALAQAYSFSIIGAPNAMKNVTQEMFNAVEERKAFVHEYWDRITDLFGGIWIPYHDSPSDRLKYVREQRSRQNVLFQAVFLLALGRLGHAIGQAANWNPNSPLLKKLSALDPEIVSYYAQNPTFPSGYDSQWTDAMMKPAKNPETGRMDRYTFNNVSDTVSNTARLLAEKVGVEYHRPAGEDGEEIDDGAAD
ncbi:DNA sulfur modification protein DndB [Deinococcus knuensis]|uniref:DGQHR domain-containing protein n=1 Tax=Deinococcus knuensis TaxID=1837380 RepID=A0ABQ2SUT6_9DEIO|nr:DNA sulfur modification protein DndB [Deinococcus knuensis]GGS38771.1 hypothetical protein GCM10008961_32810 [Deinococcus knuensis]